MSAFFHADRPMTGDSGSNPGSSRRPLVSVIVPFYNTAEHIAECIESILAQSYPEFELLLVNNHSTDGSASIAESFVGRDPRVRLLHNPAFVGQVDNYNGAVRHASSTARYLKIVQADDLIFPECLERMVAVGEAHPSAVIITSYYLKGCDVLGDGVPYPQSLLAGRDALRLHLLRGKFLFGSPTTVMFRSTLLAKRNPFYAVGPMHEDTELIYDELAHGDAGFVHQVLTYSRVREGSILSGMATYDWQLLDFYITVKKFGPASLSPEEYHRAATAVTREYRLALGRARLFRREAAYWTHHRRALASCGEGVPSSGQLLPFTLRALVSAVRHPRWALEQWRAARRAEAS